MEAEHAKIISVIGAGGKTTLCRALMRALPGRRVFSTTTHIFLPPELPCLIEPDAPTLTNALFARGALCVTGPLLKGSGKATSPSERVFTQLRAEADALILEADGARAHLIKAHGAHEPVVPPDSDLVLCVMSHAALGLPLFQAVHRSERIGDVFSKDPSSIVTETDFLSAARAARARVALDIPFFAVLNAVSDAHSGAMILTRLARAGIPAYSIPRCPDGADPVAFAADALSRSPLFLEVMQNLRSGPEPE